MPDREKKRFSPPAVGGISLLVVFAVLCLTVFALLSLSTVRADSGLGQASAQAVQDYYAADCAAQEILARLRQGEKVEGVQAGTDAGEISYAYTVPIGDSQALRVEVRFKGADYEILRWQTQAVGERDYDNSLHVWDGQ